MSRLKERKEKEVMGKSGNVSRALVDFFFLELDRPSWTNSKYLRKDPESGERTSFYLMDSEVQLIPVHRGVEFVFLA